MRLSIARASLCASSFVFSTCASAQTSSDVSTLSPVVVTASRTPQPLSDALPATTVITREDIADSGAVDVASLLRGRAGVDIAQSGGLGSQTSLFLRGSNSNQVLVLVDGMRINAVGSGAASLAHLMVDQIDRIEVVRGNVSSLYGSEAIGGVVQIFTRGGSGGDAPRLAASGSYGNERSRAVSLEGAQAFGPADARTRFGVAASYRSQNGFSAIDADRVAAANPDDDGYRNTSVSAHVSQQFGAHEVGVRYVESRGHLQFDETTDYRFIDPSYDGRVQTHDERSRQNDALAYARLAVASFWTIDLGAAQTRDLSVNTSSNPFSFVNGSTTSTDRQYRFGNTLRFGAQTLTAGYEHLDQTGFSTSYGNGVDGAAFTRHVDSVMAGYVGSLFLPSINEFQLNARHDDYSDFGGATTGLAAYGLRFARGWKAIVQASTAFKAPAFNELYFPFFGNPALRPERARNVEVALQYAADATLVRLSAFRVRTRDLIVYDPALFLANNVDRAKVSGVELGARTVVDGWTLSTDLTFARPVDEGTRQLLLRRSTRNGRVAIAKSFGPWRVSADVVAAGRRFDTDVVTFARTTLAGYATTNAGVRYALARHVTIGAEVTNAFDRRYALVDGYRVPGRVALVTLGFVD